MKVEDYVNHHPLEEGQWIEGLGWDQNLWKDKVFPAAVSACSYVLQASRADNAAGRI